MSASGVGQTAERARSDALPGAASASAWWLPALVAIGTVVVEGVGLGRPSYWFDEAASVSAAERPFGRIVDLAGRVDAVHASYYSLLHLWTEVFGTSEVATRSLSLIALALANVGVAVFALRIGGTLFAACAGVAVVLLPGIAWAGGEARGYSLALACSVWSAVVLQSALTRNRWADWVLYGLLCLAAVAFSIWCLLAVVFHVYFAVTTRRLLWRRFAVAWAAVVLVSAPLLVAALSQREQVGWIDVTPKRLGGKLLLGQLFLGPRNGSGLSASTVSAAVAFCVTAVVAAIGLLRSTGRARDIARLGLIWWAAPTVLLALPVLAGLQLYQERYLLFAAPGACVLLAGGAQALRRRTALLVAAVFVAACVAPLVAQRGEASKGGDDYRALARFGAGSDAVVYSVTSARGIAIAYPRFLRGSRDVAERRTPEQSNSLWGVNRHAAELDLRGARTVVVYWPTKQGKALRKISAALARQRCLPQPHPVRTARFVGVRYICGASPAS